MTLEWWQILAAAAVVGTAMLGIIRWQINAAAVAEAALREAQDVRNLAQSAHEKITFLTAALSAHQVTQAERLVSREVLRQVEDRLADAIQRLGDRFDDILKELVKR
jgi:CRP-like cAMP-binding protein